MAVSWNQGARASQTPLIADRNLYLDAAGTTVVEEGHATSASQLVATGHSIAPADADRLGLVMKDGRVEQDRAVKLEDHQALVDDLAAERAALAEQVEQYKTAHATKDIPNTMEAARVALETRYEHAVLALGQFIKAADGKDPLKGESQATALKPETSAIARDATARANEAIAASPSPVSLAKNAPTAPAQVAPQHADAPPPAADAPAATTATPAEKKPAKKSGRKRGT